MFVEYSRRRVLKKIMAMLCEYACAKFVVRCESVCVITQLCRATVEKHGARAESCELPQGARFSAQ